MPAPALSSVAPRPRRIVPSGASAVGFAIAANSLDQDGFGSAYFSNKPSWLNASTVSYISYGRPSRLCRLAVFSTFPSTVSLSCLLV